LEDYSPRSLNKNELLIKVTNCGVCGTDRHIYEGKAPSKVPVILGHEYTGIVVENGSSNSKFKVDDRITIDPNIFCGYCDYCKRGKVHFCENHQALGVTLNGGFAEYSIVPASQAYLIPPDFDLSLASFAEPLSCCLRGMELAGIKHGDSVIVVGGGTIGLMMVQLAKNAGASRILLIEPVTSKQRLGLELGADYGLNPFENNLLEKVKSLLGYADRKVIECVGSSETVDLSVKLAGKGGAVIIFGLAPKEHEISLNLQSLFKNEVKILNSYLNPFTFASAIDLLINGKINVQKLISNQVSLREIITIFNNKGDSTSIKQQIRIN
jgi:L-iditol 2-dehydrogenase